MIGEKDRAFQFGELGIHLTQAWGGRPRPRGAPWLRFPW